MNKLIIKKIEENIVNDIVNDKKNWFSNWNRSYKSTEYSWKNKTTECWWNGHEFKNLAKKWKRRWDVGKFYWRNKTWLNKILTDTSSKGIADDIINVNDWENKTEIKNKLDLGTQQNYNESATEIIKTNNADLLQQMINNNQNKNQI